MSRVACRVSRGGHVSLTLGWMHGYPAGPLAHAGGVLGRVPGLTAVGLETLEVPGWLAERPDLLGLSLTGLTRFDPAPLAGLTELRVVHVEMARGADCAPVVEWVRTLSRLECLSPGTSWRTFALVTGDPVRLPTLRVLHVAGVSPDFDVPNRLDTVTPNLDATEAFGGVTLRRPISFVPLPAPSADTGVETLATWVEWGDGDPRFRVSDMGPAWVTLERLPFPVRVADAASALSGPPGTLADVSEWGRLRRVQSPLPHTVIEGSCPFAEHARVLWSGKRRALRLRVECPRAHARAAALAEAIAGTLAGSVDG